jgi:hypothetical protein
MMKLGVKLGREAIRQFFSVNGDGPGQMNLVTCLQKSLHDRIKKRIDAIRHVQKISPSKQNSHADSLSPLFLLESEKGGPTTLLTRFAEKLCRALGAGDYGVNVATFADLV